MTFAYTQIITTPSQPEPCAVPLCVTITAHDPPIEGGIETITTIWELREAETAKTGRTTIIDRVMVKT